MTAPAVDWRERAACAGHDTAIWFATNPAEAQTICRGCPVRAECLHHALETEPAGHRYGIYGGLTRA